MSLFARILGLFLMFGLTLPLLLSAQEQKKDKVAADKKEAKDAKEAKGSKDDDKSEPKKKDSKKEPEEKLVYGQVVTAKIKRMDANSNKDFTIEMPVVDQQKVYDLNVWKVQQIQSISQSTSAQQLQQRQFSYQSELLRRQNNIYSMKDFDMRGSEQIKVRSYYPPIEYDDRGFLKKWTKKELVALKGDSKLPGYPSTMENLRPGQTVQIYLAKTAKNLPQKGQKKKIDDDDGGAFDRPEAVMIVITQEVAPGGN